VHISLYQILTANKKTKTKRKKENTSLYFTPFYFLPFPTPPSPNPKPRATIKAIKVGWYQAEDYTKFY
jgi:hypothetical protein